MLSEIFGEGIVIFLLLAFAVYWVKYNLIDVPKMEREEAERKAQEKTAQKAQERESIDSDLELIARAKKLLPDVHGAMELLTSRFGGTQIAESFGLYYTHMELIDYIRLYEGEKIRLPNFQSSNYKENEISLLKIIIEKSSPNVYGDQEIDESNYHQFLDEIGFYGIDAYAQEPTVYQEVGPINWTVNQKL